MAEDTSIEQSQEPEEQVSEPLDINKLIDKPLNELTEEEAEFVIEWKAKKQFEQAQFEERNRIIREEAQARADAYGAEAQANIELLEELRDRALAFYSAQ